MASVDHSSERQREILGAALQAFDRNGITQTSIADICAASGASVGSIYHHFGSKDGIVTALVTTAMHQHLAAIGPTLRSGEPAAEAIGALIGAVLAWVEAKPTWARFIYRQTAIPAPAVQAALQRTGPEWTTLLDQAWQRWHHAGHVRNVAEPIRTALLLGPTHELSRQWLNHQPGDTALTQATAPLAEAARRALGVLAAP